jgi:hypothetical protein
MKKTLVYHLYINGDGLNQKISYRLHQECLKRYIHIFDAALFVLTINDLTNTKVIGEALTWINELNFGKEYDIKVELNDPLCESKTFCDYVLNNKNLEGLVFFGHNKGTNNFESTNPNVNKDSVFMWVCGLYYYNLTFMDEVNGALCGKQFYPECMYGAFLMEKDCDDSRIFLSPYHYAGNFYWLNIDYYRQLILLDKIKDVKATNPMFSEMFPGYQFTPFAGGGLKTHNDIRFLMSEWDGSLYTMNKEEWCYLSNTLDGNQNFIEFVNNVSFNIGYNLYDKI